VEGTGSGCGIVTRMYTVLLQPNGCVAIAPQVLTAVISQTAQAVPGVARLGHVPRASIGSLLGQAVSDAGVLVQVTQNAVRANCYLVATPDSNLLELGMAVQATVAAAIRELVGMAVDQVNVYIQDVEVGRG
jgi:uncharacterized alkaline shock family protein YloU